MNVIETNQLTKTYKNFTAVSNLNMHVKKRSIYGFLGPNGAGKSTTLKMLLGLIAPSSGSLTVNGLVYPADRRKILATMGSLIEAPAYYGNLTGKENLDLISSLLDLSSDASDEALELVGLQEFKQRQVKKYSLGMKQRLGIALAMISKPEILLLDEPTNGLDPIGIHEIRQLILSLPERYDCTVLISSHLLSEVELLADEIGIINRGQLLFEGSFAQLHKHAVEQQLKTTCLEETFLALIQRDNQATQGGWSPC